MKKKRKKGLDLPQFTQPRSTRTVGLKNCTEHIWYKQIFA